MSPPFPGTLSPHLELLLQIGRPSNKEMATDFGNHMHTCYTEGIIQCHPMVHNSVRAHNTRVVIGSFFRFSKLFTPPSARMEPQPQCSWLYPSPPPLPTPLLLLLLGQKCAFRPATPANPCKLHRWLLQVVAAMNCGFTSVCVIKDHIFMILDKTCPVCNRCVI